MSTPFDSDDRIDPPLRADEATTLRAFLTFHRDTFRWKCAGLTAQQLSQPLAPSSMTLGGMMFHLALVESAWFEETLRGGSLMPPFDTVDWQADHDWEWHTARDHSPSELRAVFDDACRRADEIIDETLRGPHGLDALSVVEARNDQGRYSLRWILVHMIEEYARHNGHADLLREAIDGRTGE
jgi:uncharacterized damage-inducible protein DinB